MSLVEFLHPQKSRAIEASAGTGKTYTLERIVLKLLLAHPDDLIQPGRQMDIDELVLVTFTEKAAGELRERIRLIIEETIAELRAQVLEAGADQGAGANASSQWVEDILHLESNLNRLDQANISTIHGFCLKVLKTYAFESKSSFGLDLIQDELGLKQELRRFLRQDSFSSNRDLGEIETQLWLELTEYLVSKEDKVIRLAQQFLSGGLTSGEALTHESFAEFQDHIRGVAAPVQSQLDQIQEELYQYFSERLDGIQAIVDDILSRDKGMDSGVAQDCLNQAKAWLELLPQSTPQEWCQYLSTHGIVDKVPKALQAHEALLKDLKKHCQLKGDGRVKSQFKDQMKPLKAELSLYDEESFVASYAVTYTAKTIADRWAHNKVLKGQISFDDMIMKVAHTLREPGSLLKRKLREVYRYGIIDEFQDTDSNQWSIFKDIFLDSPQHVLYVVGDRKQSIYGFRGADLETFDAALKEIAERDHQSAHHLESNFRSTPAMIQSYNRLFSSSTDKTSFFSKQSEQSSYQAVQSGFEGKEAQVLNKILGSDTKTWSPEFYQSQLQGDSAIYYTRVEADSSPSAYRQYAQQVAQHLKQLIVQSQATSAPIRPNQIAVIYQSHARSREMRQALEALGLPCSVFKEEGVFQSQSTLQWVLLCEALSSQQTLSSEVRKSLMTWFFRVQPEVLSDTENWSQHPSIQSALRHLDHWRRLYRQRQWGVLFDTIIRQSNVMNTIELQEESERTLADLFQVMDWMIEYLTSHSGTWNDLILQLRGFYTREIPTSQDQNYFAKESERDAVQFMTMHSSKGLEFPIVINVMTINDKNHSDGYYIVKPSAGRQELYWNKDFPLDIGMTVKERADQERDEERARLYYVALTRASLFQYVPVFAILGKGKEPKYRSPWPFDVFEVAAQGNYIPDQERDVEALDPQMTQTTLHDKIPGVTQGRQDLMRECFAQLKMPFQTSYSDLAHGVTAQSHDGGSLDELNHLLNYTPEDRRLIAEQTTLTPGSQTGDLLHNLFELSTWSEVLEQPIESLSDVEGTLAFNQLLRQELKKAGLWTQDQDLLRQRCQEATRIVKHTLECPIQDPSDPQDEFCLGQLAPVDYIPEMEFQFSFGPQGQLFSSDAHGGGWVKGFMDLVFRREISPGCQRYYVLDWKSNALLEYNSEEITKSMNESHYYVQAKLYQLALHQWLKQMMGSSYVPESNLGGAIYAYVRGNVDQPLAESFLNVPFEISNIQVSLSEFEAQIQAHPKMKMEISR